MIFSSIAKIERLDRKTRRAPDNGKNYCLLGQNGGLKEPLIKKIDIH